MAAIGQVDQTPQKTGLPPDSGHDPHKDNGVDHHNLQQGREEFKGQGEVGDPDDRDQGKGIEQVANWLPRAIASIGLESPFPRLTYHGSPGNRHRDGRKMQKKACGGSSEEDGCLGQGEKG